MLFLASFCLLPLNYNCKKSKIEKWITIYDSLFKRFNVPKVSFKLRKHCFMLRSDFHGKCFLKGNWLLSSYLILFRWNHLKFNILIEILKRWRPPLLLPPSFSVPVLLIMRGRGVINLNKNFAYKFASTIFCIIYKLMVEQCVYESCNKCFIAICTLKNIPITGYPFSTYANFSEKQTSLTLWYAQVRKFCECIKWMIFDNIFSSVDVTNTECICNALMGILKKWTAKKTHRTGIFWRRRDYGRGGRVGLWLYNR